MDQKQRVIDYLNQILSIELTAIDQYFVHSRMYKDWGYSKLFERLDHEMDDEKGHVDLLIQRILFLEGHPDLSHRYPIAIGRSVLEMMQNDLKLEHKGILLLREAIAFTKDQAQDFGTADMLVKLLKDSEEDHALWLSQQIGHIDKLSLPVYLQTTL